MHAGIPPPRGRHHPPEADTPQSRHPLPGADTPRSRHPPEQTPPKADIPWEQTPHWKQTPPQQQTLPTSRHPPGADTSLPKIRPLLRTVHILLECILVFRQSLLKSLSEWNYILSVFIVLPSSSNKCMPLTGCIEYSMN